MLPFENLSPDPANAFFTDGMHEEILSTIANRASNLEVISRTTMMVYRATPKSVSEIARELGVTHVLEGSVRREGQTVRLTLQLIDARNDAHLWSKNFDRSAEQCHGAAIGDCAGRGLATRRASLGQHRRAAGARES